MASPLSPSSSPRLPSPPPIAEDQLGPKSPLPATEEQQKLSSSLGHGASRRIRPGTKADDMTEGPPLLELSEIHSAFQLTEHLKALHNFLTHPTGLDAIVPVDREIALKLATPPENVDRTLWLYELCRFLTQKVNAIIIALFSDSPPCSSTTCPEMRASEWQYLCAVHDPPKSCCAIDYCCHTLDWAANTLTSPKNFPSRLAMGTDQPTHSQQQRNLTNIFRRVYRIFAHAWFQHRDMFWKVEGRTGLYVLFKTVCDEYGLIPEDNYTIPPEAEGVEVSEETSRVAPMMLKRDPSGPSSLDVENTSVVEAGDHTLSTAGTTKRHRHSPSMSASAVTTVLEESEEEESEEKRSPPNQDENISTIESTSQTTQAPVEDVTEPEKDQKAGVDAQSTDATATEQSHATEESEKQSTSEEDDEVQASETATKSEATVGDESAPAALAASEKKDEEDDTSEAHATEAHATATEANPEKAEKEKEDEAATEQDKAATSE